MIPLVFLACTGTGEEIRGPEETRQSADEDAIAGADVDGIDDDAAPSTRVFDRVPHDDLLFGGEFAHEITDVAAGGPGFIAVGYDTGGPHPDAYVHTAVVWTSVDGRTWIRIPDDVSGLGDRGFRMQGVTPHGAGFVAVGGDGLSPVVWHSSDGESWSHLPDDAVEPGGASGFRSMYHVAEFRSGFVAVGTESLVDIESRGSAVAAAVWISGDGTTWSRVDHDEVFNGAIITSIIRGGPGLIAVGSYEDGSVLSWTSSDGRSWSPAPQEAAESTPTARIWMSSVAAGDPGLVSVGYDQNLQAAAVWTSPDGLFWSRVEHSSSFGSSGERMSEVVRWGSSFVAVGSHPDRGSLVWILEDGENWSLLDIEAESGDGVIRALATDGDVLVAGGWAFDPSEIDSPESVTEERRVAALWTSRPN